MFLSVRRPHRGGPPTAAHVATASSAALPSAAPALPLQALHRLEWPTLFVSAYARSAAHHLGHTDDRQRGEPGPTREPSTGETRREGD